jgi:peptidyl-prolyl cis-trans isomerase SurA
MHPIAPIRTNIRSFFAGWMGLAVVSILLFAATTARAQAPMVLDRVVAVVNQRPILSSDLDDEIRLSILDTTHAGEGPLTRAHALEQLISRTLVEQQIRQEDMEAAQPSPADVDARIAELRRDLPACVHRDCTSDTGWQTFLAQYGLTPRRVRVYMRYRLEILRFIESRFRPGIHISQQEIERYYRETLQPQYPAEAAAPPLDQVAPRIEEILLEQQVSALFDQWLQNLRKQGDVEILDPSLETAAAQTPQAAGAQ